MKTVLLQICKDAETSLKTCLLSHGLQNKNKASQNTALGEGKKLGVSICERRPAEMQTEM